MTVFTRFCYLIFGLLAFTACGNQNKEAANSNAVVVKNNETPPAEEISGNVVLDGEYECYMGPEENGYLYHKLTLHRKGNAVSGTLFSGYYLSKAEQGYYTMPAGTITSVVTGSIAGKEQVMLYLGTVQDSSLMEDDGKLPDQKKLFEEDAQGDAAALIYKKGDHFYWLMGNDTLVFEKAPAINAE